MIAKDNDSRFQWFASVRDQLEATTELWLLDKHGKSLEGTL